jgi:hypothetical protein
LIKVEGRTVLPDITQIINNILNSEEFFEEWNDLIIVPNSKKGDKTACSNYRGILLLSIACKIFNILLPIISTNAEEILGND